MKWLGISPDELTDDDIRALVAKLESIVEIDGYEVEEFLSYASKRSPQAVVRLLLKRIERDKQDHRRDYRPLPFQGFHNDLSGVVESDEYEAILREVRDGALEKNWATYFWLPKLFAQLSDRFGPVCLRILKEWIDSGEQDKIEAAGKLLWEAPSSFVFSEVEYVDQLLTALGPHQEGNV